MRQLILASLLVIGMSGLAACGSDGATEPERESVETSRQGLSVGQWMGWVPVPSAPIGFISGPGTASGMTDRLDVVAQGSNGLIYRTVWTTAGWAPWASLPLHSFLTGRKPAVAALGTTTFVASLDATSVFVTDNHTGSFGSWALVPDSACTGAPAMTIVTVTKVDGPQSSLYLFCAHSDSRVYWTKSLIGNGLGAWAAWQSNPTAAVNKNAALDAKTTDRKITVAGLTTGIGPYYLTTLTPDTNSWTAWSKVFNGGVVFDVGPGLVSTPSVLRAVDVFGPREPDGLLVDMTRSSLETASVMSPRQTTTSEVGATTFAHGTGNNRLYIEMFVRGADNAIYENAYRY